MTYPNENDSKYAASAAVKPATIQSAIDNFDPLIERIEKLAQAARNCANKIVGSQPSGVEVAKDVPPPNHLIFSIQARHDRLARASDVLESEMERIGRGLD